MGYQDYSLELKLIENVDHEKHRKMWEQRGFNGSDVKQWTASISGPWYVDSNPEGKGHTIEEAKQGAISELIKIRDGINKFLEQVQTDAHSSS